MSKIIAEKAIKWTAWALLLLGLGYVVPANAQQDYRAPDLDCLNVRVPVGHKVAFYAYAEGVQIYRWNSITKKWDFVGPEAVLYANADADGAVGAHYFGPTWETISGSYVVGRVLERCTPDPTAIPWLLLEAVDSDGPGVLDGVSHIQRVNTVGGLAPAEPGEFPGEEARVPYTADYYFYRQHQ
jgi:hypothetical protein